MKIYFTVHAARGDVKAKTENSARDRRSDETKIVEFELGCGELHEQLRGDWRVADPATWSRTAFRSRSFLVIYLRVILICDSVVCPRRCKKLTALPLLRYNELVFIKR